MIYNLTFDRNHSRIRIKKQNLDKQTRNMLVKLGFRFISRRFTNLLSFSILPLFSKHND